jgi:hypothetical protein
VFWVRFPAGAGNFLFTTASRTALGPTQPPNSWVPGVLSLGVKRPDREADHSPPSSTDVKNAWSYTSTPQYVFMAWYLVKHRVNFTLPLPYRACGGPTSDTICMTTFLVHLRGRAHGITSNSLWGPPSLLSNGFLPRG